MNLKEKAGEAAGWFETATRDNRETFYRLKEGRPEWVQELCFAAHGNGDMMPDDFRYRFIVDAVNALADADDPDDVETPEVDIYNHTLLAWLSSNLNRIGYVGEALEDGGHTSLMDAVMSGQARERDEVMGYVRSFLEEMCEDDENLCDECGANIPDGDGGVANKHHAESCSLYDASQD